MAPPLGPPRVHSSPPGVVARAHCAPTGKSIVAHWLRRARKELSPAPLSPQATTTPMHCLGTRHTHTHTHKKETCPPYRVTWKSLLPKRKLGSGLELKRRLNSPRAALIAEARPTDYEQQRRRRRPSEKGFLFGGPGIETESVCWGESIVRGLSCWLSSRGPGWVRCEGTGVQKVQDIYMYIMQGRTCSVWWKWKFVRLSFLLVTKMA